MKIIDISRSLTPALAVWPGDQAYQPTWSARIDQGDTVNVGAVQMSTHTGTHLDAPLHYLAEGKAIHEIPLLQLVGTCLIILIDDAAAITPEHVASNHQARIPRILFKTRHSHVPDSVWDPNFVAILPETIDVLSSQGVILIGTDAPSVDPVDSKTLDAHKALAMHGIVNLENLSLKDVEPGVYDLVALPLKLIGLDAAPVRAILIQE